MFIINTFEYRDIKDNAYEVLISESVPCIFIFYFVLLYKVSKFLYWKLKKSVLNDGIMLKFDFEFEKGQITDFTVF